MLEIQANVPEVHTIMLPQMFANYVLEDVLFVILMDNALEIVVLLVMIV